jgi:hypothetical protein
MGLFWWILNMERKHVRRRSGVANRLQCDRLRTLTMAIARAARQTCATSLFRSCPSTTANARTSTSLHILGSQEWCAARPYRLARNPSPRASRPCMAAPHTLTSFPTPLLRLARRHGSPAALRGLSGATTSTINASLLSTSSRLLTRSLLAIIGVMSVATAGRHLALLAFIFLSCAPAVSAGTICNNDCPTGGGWGNQCQDGGPGSEYSGCA